MYGNERKFLDRQTDRQTDNLNSLQALRALAFFGIFTNHTFIRCFLGAGPCGVSIFFVLSGFLMIYGYYGKGRIETVSFRENLLFAKRKIKGLYPLHIITMFAMSLFMFTGDKTEPLIRIIFKFFLNIFLIQEWVPMQNPSINGVSWYLCSALFLYFIFPWILKYMEKEYSVEKAKKMIIFLFLCQILSGLIGKFLAVIPTDRMIVESWWPEDITNWFLYRNPLIRVLDFTIGCNTGYLFLMRNKKESGDTSEVKYTIAELLTVVLIIAANICYVALFPQDAMPHPERWWTYSIIFTIPSCLTVYLFALNKGGISKVLTNRVTVYIGNISQYTYLIHRVVFQYIIAVCHVLVSEKFSFYYAGWINLTLGFVLTIFATKIWMKLIHKKIPF